MCLKLLHKDKSVILRHKEYTVHGGVPKNLYNKTYRFNYNTKILVKNNQILPLVIEDNDIKIYTSSKQATTDSINKPTCKEIYYATYS